MTVPVGLAEAASLYADVRVVVLGSLNIDHVAQVQWLPAAGETLLADSYAVHSGGKGRNQAVALARLGGQVTLVGATGEDAGGSVTRAELGALGIDTTQLVTAPDGVPTGLALITVDARGENTIVVHPGANAHARAPADLTGCHVLLCSLEPPLEVVADATARACAVGVMTVVNAAPMRGVTDGTLGSALANADIIVVNESEARELLRAPEAGREELGILAVSWSAATTAVLVVTMGSGGALVVAAGGSSRVPAQPVDAVNTVGAGDTFAAMLALALGAGRPLLDAARLACAAGAITVSRPAELCAENVEAMAAG